MNWQQQKSSSDVLCVARLWAGCSNPAGTGVHHLGSSESPVGLKQVFLTLSAFKKGRQEQHLLMSNYCSVFVKNEVVILLYSQSLWSCVFYYSSIRQLHLFQ